MVRKAKNVEAIEQLKSDQTTLNYKLSELYVKVNALEFKIKVAGLNGHKVNFKKLNDYYPKLDALYTERNTVFAEYDKLSRRLDKMT